MKQRASRYGMEAIFKFHGRRISCKVSIPGRVGEKKGPGRPAPGRLSFILQRIATGSSRSTGIHRGEPKTVDGRASACLFQGCLGFIRQIAIPAGPRQRLNQSLDQSQDQSQDQAE